MHAAALFNTYRTEREGTYWNVKGACWNVMERNDTNYGFGVARCNVRLNVMERTHISKI